MNKINRINAEDAPAAVGPYCHVVTYGDMVFTSGQIPLDASTGEVVPGGITEQTEQVIKNLKLVLEAAGSNLDNVLKTTCFLHDMADFAKFNAVYANHFSKKPARSCVAVKTLPMNVLCEIEVVAVKI